MIEKIEEKYYSNNGNINVITSVDHDSRLILDVGCGAGDNARILSQMGKTVDGITLSESEAAEAGKYCRKIFIHNLEDGLPTEINQKYDVVICSHVLEHLRFPDKVLSDIKLKLNSNSKLIVALPNIMVYKYRFKLLLGSFDYENGGIMDNTHFKWYTFKSGKKLLEDNGYLVVKSWVNGGIPFGKVTGFLSASMQRKIKNLLFSISPGFFGGELLYVAKPNSD